MEKQTIGIYLSGHPTDGYADKIKAVTKHTINDIISSVEYDDQLKVYKHISGKLNDNDKITVCGVIAARKNKTTRSNAQMAIVTLEDRYGSVEVLVFPRQLQMLSHKLSEEALVALTGRVSISDDEAPKLICESAMLVDELSFTKVYIKFAKKDSSVINQLASVTGAFPGKTPIVLYFEDTKERLNAPESMRINENSAAIAQLKAVFGEDSVVVKT